MLGVFWRAAMGAVALGSLSAPLLLRAIGTQTAFVVVGALLPLVTAAAYRGLITLDGLGLPLDRRHAIESVPIFAPLSLATKERLASRLTPVQAAAGDCVIQQGDAGDDFYIIASDELDVLLDQRRLKLGPDDYFGEIALLRNIPRTATVIAAADSQLFSLQRDDFLTTVTGHTPAKQAADAVVESRLGVHP